MKFLKPLLNFYINSSIHVAFAVFSLSWLTLIQFGLAYDGIVLPFVFFATITGYNFVKYYAMAKFHHRNLPVWLKWIQVWSFICFTLVCYYGVQLQGETLCWIATCGLATFFYAMPFFSKRLATEAQQNLRNVKGLKIYIIALSWVGVTVFLPLAESHRVIRLDVVLVAVQRVLFVMVLMLPFEIRDLKYDSPKLNTIPQKLGLKKTKTLGAFLLMIILVLEALRNEVSFNDKGILLVVVLVTFLFLMFSNKEQNRYYCSLWVESVSILWLVLMVLLS
ncbi:hypothetical protein ACFFU9_10880 [Mariniflexile ostreae]|uniref:UbiA prenyltransferase family protein n=1 Tax=Mariniflexile ostreae TaxID=1520892 RepID=A0ABV5FCS4_9FLAO